MKNLFIVFEGIDGSGKSTQCDLFYQYLGREKIPSVKLFEPTNGETGRRIRKILSSPEMPDSLSLIDLFINDREEDNRLNIGPALERGETVVMDRYYYSNAAYQGDGRVSSTEIIRMNREKKFPKPDRVYFIDIPVDLAIERINIRRNTREKEVFERHDFLEKVRNNFLDIRDDTFKIIDGSGSIEEINKMIIEDFSKLYSGA